jgi:hypothetical protein
MNHAHRVRGVILRHLAALAEDLGQFDQTCHGVLSLGEKPWEQLGKQIGLVGEQPTAFNISTLVQDIVLILKRCGWDKRPEIEPRILKVHEILAEPQTIHEAVHMCEDMCRRAINRIEHENIHRTGFHLCSFLLGRNRDGNIELRMEMTNAPREAYAQLPDGTTVKINTNHLEATGDPILRHPETGDMIPCLEEQKPV